MNTGREEPAAPERDLLEALRDLWQFVPPGSRLDVRCVQVLNQHGVTDARPRPSADPPTPPDIIEVLLQAKECCAGQAPRARDPDRDVLRRLGKGRARHPM
jgi:hypothetical protein